MVFIETSAFTKWITQIMSDEDYRRIQNELMKRPDSGKLIPSGSGLRKLRCAVKAKGKRGGARIIYYWIVNDDKILMLYAYEKSIAEDLTIDQIKGLLTIVRNYLK
jgi:mRNA-degrading endonuclease RelE of RelBE toxin-antitoxin system